MVLQFDEAAIVAGDRIVEDEGHASIDEDGPPGLPPSTVANWLS